MSSTQSSFKSNRIPSVKSSVTHSTIDVPDDEPSEKYYHHVRGVPAVRRPYLRKQVAAKIAKHVTYSNSIRSSRKSKRSHKTHLHSIDRALSISSESNTSQTELQGKHEHDPSSPWHSGCCIWIQQVLKYAIDDILNGMEDFQSARKARAVLDESNNQLIWQQMPIDCLDVGVLYAALHANLPMLRFFLSAGGEADAADLTNRTALHYAASSPGADAAECIRLLIEKGAKVDAWDQDEEATPLICASASGRIDILEALLEAGADVNSGQADFKHPNRASALVWAVRGRSLACASRLIAAGASVNSTQVYSETPLHVAASQGDVECMKLLLDNHADARVVFGDKRMNPLHLAAAEGNVGCIRILLRAGKGEIDSCDSRGRTPLHLAALSQSVESVSELLKNGAKMEVMDDNNNTPLHSAVIKSSRSTDVVRLFITWGINLNARDVLGQTALHLAALNENSKLATILILAGADLAIKNNGGASALSFVVRRIPDALAAIPRRIDTALSLADHDVVDPDCELKLDFRVLAPSGDQDNSGEMGFLTSLVQCDQRLILQHPVIKAFLYLKWFKIRALLIASLIFHACFVFSLTYTIYTTYVENYKANDTRNQTVEPKDEPDDKTPALVVEAFTYFTFLCGAFLLAKESFQFFQYTKDYVCDLENISHLISVFGVIAVCIPVNAMVYTNWQRHIAAVTIIVSWVNLMMHVGRFPVFGLYVQMFTTVAMNIGKLLLAYLSLIMGFSFGFAVMFPNNEFLAHMPGALLTTIVMTTGEFEYHRIFYESNDHRALNGTTQVVFLLFVLFIVIILMNLLVGLAVSDIQGLQKSAVLDRLVRETRLMARLEGFVFLPWFKHLPGWAKAIVLFQRSFLVIPPNARRSYTFRPNDLRDCLFPPDIKEGLMKIILHSKAIKTGQHPHIYRTFTPTVSTDDTTAELFEEVIHRVDTLFNNYMSQILLMNTTVEEHLARLDSQTSQHGLSVVDASEC